VKGNFEGIGQGFGFHVGPAVGHPDLQAVFVIKPCHYRIGFGLKIGFFRSHKSVFPDIIGFLEVLINIPCINVHMNIDIVGEFLVDEFCFRCHGFHGIKHGRKFFVFHINEIKGFKGSLFIHSRHTCHFIPDVPGFFLLDELLVTGVGKYAPFDAFRIFSCYHGLYAGKCQGF